MENADVGWYKIISFLKQTRTQTKFSKILCIEKTFSNLCIEAFTKNWIPLKIFREKSQSFIFFFKSDFSRLSSYDWDKRRIHWTHGLVRCHHQSLSTILKPRSVRPRCESRLLAVWQFPSWFFLFASSYSCNWNQSAVSNCLISRTNFSLSSMSWLKSTRQAATNASWSTQATTKSAKALIHQERTKINRATTASNSNRSAKKPNKEMSRDSGQRRRKKWQRFPDRQMPR